jgi:hypothetical protein
VKNNFERFIEHIEELLDTNGLVKLTENINLTSITKDAFKYKGDNWGRESRINHKDFIKLAIHNTDNKVDLKFPFNLSNHAFYRKSYYGALLSLFFKFAGEYKPISNTTVSLKNFVLIIDEINRANLPSVLGELIYALEYRGEPVASVYEIEDDNTLILPPNLLIIGTMNTADRSVGHIDYAIRRRFAFVEVPPSGDVIDEVIKTEPLRTQARNLYKSVSDLFIKDNLASDFKSKDVQLGHSYFLAKDEVELKRKLEYEIKPILREYLKDGILLESTEEAIEKLIV